MSPPVDRIADGILQRPRPGSGGHLLDQQLLELGRAVRTLYDRAALPGAGACREHAADGRNARRHAQHGLRDLHGRGSLQCRGGEQQPLGGQSGPDQLGQFLYGHLPDQPRHRQKSRLRASFSTTRPATPIWDSSTDCAPSTTSTCCARGAECPSATSPTC